ncbi:SusC/RagA family TonB-linked outer membrane protein [Flavisolibacter tropicus]|uniref:TonB-dependent receptor n=1 Tax=Flavisolibacter tropicus TaxID=1492898 RepID=A0A172TSM2_9BACT|nr:TonB-dependent receptor [Flavisolibacter tropicus]ANE49992.1 TonB-dependent receptor [Flavisolibacter tropicus]
MRKFMLFVLLLLCYNIVVFAQTVRVTGRVTDGNGRPVENASVVVKGNRIGATTNNNGDYVINAEKGQTLLISSIGFAPQEVVVNEAAINVSLNASSQTLSDVVVVGYGTQRRANLTGSIVALNNEDLSRRQVASTNNLLQGLAPGVTVQQQSGKPGADASSIVIRGQNSISLSNTPIVVVDGLILDMSAFNQIDPNAIESITVLKDAASTSIYGNRAANGVIIVKTKRANKKGIQLSYNSFFTKQEATAIPDRVNAVEHMELSNVAERNRTGNAAAFVYSQALIDKYKTTPANNMDVINTDWLKEVLTNSGFMQNHNVQLTSGGEQVNMFASLSYLNQEGLIQNNSYEKYDLRLNPEFKLNKKLTLTGNFGYTRSKTINPSTGSAEFIIREAIGLPAIGAGKFGEGMYGNAGQSNNRNPIAQAEATGTSQTNGSTLLARFGFNYKPIEGLDIEGFWGREQRNPTTKTFIKNASIYQPNLVTNTYDKVADWPGSTTLSEAYRNDVYTTYLGQATYGFKFGDHSFKVLAGAQSELNTYYFFGASRQGFINPDQPYLNLGTGARDNNAGASESALVGLFSRINYNYRGKYLLEVNGRRDGTSRFSQALEKQWGNFGSASAGWVFTNEAFLRGLANKISFGKLRVSYGGNGNQNTGLPYAYDVFYENAGYNASSHVNGTNAYFNNVTTPGVALLQFANPELQWETARQFNAGLDLSLLKHFMVSADYFVKTQHNMLLKRTLPASAGGLGNPFINAGQLENKGWELSLNYKNQFGKWRTDLTGMLSDVQNKVLDLVEGTPYLDNGSTRTQVGYAMNSYFGYKAVGFFADDNDVKNSPVQFGVPWNASPTVGPKAGDIKYADISGPEGKPDGKIDLNDRTFIGDAFPRYEYSLNFNIGYGNFDLNILGQGVGKRNNYLSGTGAVPFNSGDFAASLLAIHKNYWSPENPNADFPRLLPSGFGGNNYLTSTQWIRSASYFRIKNVNLGYRLPATVLNKVNINSVRVFIAGSNLATFSKAWKGFDPEINSANAEFYPLMRTWTAGLNVNF